MDDKDWLRLLKQQRSIAIIRAPSLKLGQQIASAIASEIKLIEITWSSETPADLIAQLRSQLPDCTIGAGTVLTVSDLKNAIAAGAQFIFMPHTDFDLIAIAKRHHIPIIPGALTPSEIMVAWKAKASSVKVFPIQSLGGAAYLQNLRTPLGDIPMIPTGGITIDNAKSMLNAGAIAVGLSSSLFPAAAIASEDWEFIAQQAKKLMESLR